MRKLMERDQLLTVEETAKRLALQPSTIRKFIFEKRLPVVRLGRAVRLRESDVSKLIAEGGLLGNGHMEE
jgi:excisionase family DNA binding protein